MNIVNKIPSICLGSKEIRNQLTSAQEIPTADFLNQAEQITIVKGSVIWRQEIYCGPLGCSRAPVYISEQVMTYGLSGNPLLITHRSTCGREAYPENPSHSQEISLYQHTAGYHVRKTVRHRLSSSPSSNGASFLTHRISLF